jgi:PAT family beta-lactamase induction signal transducer AmpG
MPGRATGGGNMSPFHRDMGFFRTGIGIITSICGVRVGIVGIFPGGARCPLGAIIVLCGCSNLRLLALIAHPGNLVVLTLVISGESPTLGMLGSPTEAFLLSLVHRQHTAAQYALPSSLVNLPGEVPGSFAGSIALTTGQGK